MADPKYAGLPGIALDQPDMFETSGAGDEEADEEEVSAEEPAPVLHLSSLSWLGDLEIGSGGEPEGLADHGDGPRHDCGGPRGGQVHPREIVIMIHMCIFYLDIIFNMSNLFFNKTF